MAKRNRFWGNFWGETGRNSGKWISNKVFGNAGWATPRRHIFDRDNSSSGSKNSRAKVRETTSSVKSEEFKHNWAAERVDNIIKMANQISFSNNDVEEICLKLDDLLTGARTAIKFINSDKVCNKLFSSKIKSGIMRLRRQHEVELADFYARELKSVTRAANLSKAVPWIIIFAVFIFSAIYLLFYDF